MGLLAPLFLLAGLAAAVPFWLHRLQVQSADRRPFGSAMFLETTEEQVHVRKKLRYLALLALRVAALLLVALAFAKPFWEPEAAGLLTEPLATHLVIVDRSASMQGAASESDVRATVDGILGSIRGDAVIQVLAADTGLTALSELSADRAVHRAALSGLQPRPFRLDYGGLMAAVERLAATLPPPVEVHLVSDFQASGLPANFRDLAAGSIAAFHPHRVGTAASDNRRLLGIEPVSGGIAVSIGAGEGASGSTRLQVSLNGELIAAAEVEAAARSTREFTGLMPEEGDNRVVAEVAADDALRFDNRYHYVLENIPPAPVPVVTADPGGRGVTYLDAALRAASDAGYEAQLLEVGEAEFRRLGRFRWAVVEDIGALDETAARAVEAFVTDGGNLLAFAGRRSAAVARLPVTGNTVRPAAAGAATGDFMGVTRVERTHPMLAGVDGWHTVRVSRNLVIEPGVTDDVLVRLEDGTPFLVEQRQGSGRVLLVTAGLDNDWNDLPLRPVFVGFMVEAASYLSGMRRQAKAYAAGDVLTLGSAGGLSGQVIDPRGNTVLSLSDTTRAQQVRLDQPGFYEVYTPSEEYLVAVNVDPRESNPAVIDETTLERWAEAAGAEDRRPGGTAVPAAAGPVELWPAALLLLALLMIGESAVGNLLFRPRAEG